MYSFSTQGIILRRRNFGEADRLITFFTKNKGKVSGVAKGIRKITSRRAGSVELLNHVKIYLAETKGLPILTEAVSINTFPLLKQDLQKVSLSYCIVEMIDQFFPDEQENQEIFDLLVKTLAVIEQSTFQKAKLATSAFQMKVLASSGYLPELYSCIKCKSPLLPEENYLASSLGGLVDDKCSSDSLFIKKITPSAIKVLRFWDQSSMENIGRMLVSQVVATEVVQLLNYYTEVVLDRKLRSNDFLLQVEATEVS